MAARLEIYAVAEGATIEGYDPVALDREGADRSALPDLEGWVSASDADEEELYLLLSDVADASSVDARTHGAGRLRSTDVAGFAASLRQLAAARSGLPATWLSALATAAGTVELRGTALGWRMRYDQGGSGDSGAEEFPTAWS